MRNFGVTNKEHYGMLWYFLELSNKASESHNGEFTFSFKPSFCRRRRSRVLRSKKNCGDGELFKNTVRIKYFSSQDLAHKLYKGFAKAWFSLAHKHKHKHMCKQVKTVLT